MELGRIQAFSDELQKIAARKGLKLIRQMVQRGDIEGASRLAKRPGVLREIDADIGTPFRVDGKKKWVEREFLGSQIKHLGEPGQEQLSTLVADPVHGIAVRKIRHSAAVTPASMSPVVGKFMNEAAPATAQRLEDARHGLSGKHVTFNEYVPGVPGSRAGMSGAKAIQDARTSLLSTAKQTGTLVDDIKNLDNVQVYKGPDGKVRAKFIDLIADKKQSPRNLLRPPGNKPSRDTILANTFKPKAVDRQAYAREKAEILAKAKKKPGQSFGDFLKAQPAEAPAKKADPRQAAIEAFLAQKRGN